jgi:hypothetical protein
MKQNWIVETELNQFTVEANCLSQALFRVSKNIAFESAGKIVRVHLPLQAK